MTGWIVGLAGAVFAAPQFPTSPTQSPVSVVAKPDEARDAVASCGVPRDRVSVRFERDMDEDVVWVARQGKRLGEAELACIATASLKTSYYVYFRDPTEQRRYWTVYGRIEDAANVANARAWLRERGLLSSMPVPREGAPLADYARAVETFCGIKPEALLKVVDEHMITFAEGGLGTFSDKGFSKGAVTEDQFACVMNATAAADLKSHGVFFGFIGNAAVKSR